MSERPAIIDADGHFLERQSDVRKYLPEPWNRRETPLWPGETWDSDMFETLGYDWYRRGLSPEEQVDIWHDVMRREGIETAILFPTGAGNLPKVREPAFQQAVARACNDHFAQDYQARSDRLRPVGVLPMGDAQAAAAEMRRAVKERGLTAFATLTLGLPAALGDSFYDPLYEAAQELNVPLCIHGQRNGAHEIGGDKLKTFGEVHSYAFPVGLMLHFTSIMWNAVPLRFPGLKLAFLEIGATWLPYYLDRLDEHWEKRGELEAPHLTKKPSQVFRESSVFLSIEAGEGLLGPAVDYIGDEHFVYATDLPHWDAEFPRSIDDLWRRTDLSSQTKEKIMHGNARALFGLSG